MKKRESMEMKELRKIREKIYNDIKKMSKAEMIEYFRNGADSFKSELANYIQNSKNKI